MTITFDPNGGDLGRAVIRPISPLEFKIILPHIVNIFVELKKLNLVNQPLNYAFEFPYHTKDEVNLILKNTLLPSIVGWYETDGTRLFEIRGASGGVTTGLVCYLITVEQHENHISGDPSRGDEG